jgi:hypothetical protein
MQVALVEEPGRLGDLGDGDAALEHLTRDADPLSELEAMRRHAIRSTEAPGQAVAADTRGALELSERDIGSQLVLQELAGAPKRRITTGRAAAIGARLRVVADIVQPVGEQALAFQ